MTKGEKNRKTRKRRNAYRTRRALRLIRRGQPKTVEELERLGVGPVVGVGNGAFRAAYRIYGTSLLVKFPLDVKHVVNDNSPDWSNYEGKNHTRMEVKKIRALSKFPMWKKHLPPVYYFNSRDGVLVTKFFPKGKWVEGAKSQLISEMAKTFCGITLGDLSTDNVRTTGNSKNGRDLIVVDLGY